jgi:hypothetical protein
VKTIVWNMAHKARNWGELEDKDELRGADITLLSEAARPDAPVVAIGSWITTGLERSLPPEKTVSRPWSTAVVSRHPLREITDARVDRSFQEPLPFEPSRLGTWTAALVDLDGVKVTAISIYGCWTRGPTPRCTGRSRSCPPYSTTRITGNACFWVET